MDYSVSYRNKDGGKQAIISYKVGDKWRQKSKQGFKKQSDAKKWAQREVIELEKINPVSGDMYEITVNDLVKLYTKYIDSKLSHHSVRNYKMAFRHLDPILKIKVNKLTPHNMDSVLDNFSDNAPGTIKSKIGRLTTLFNYAINHLEIISRNPCRKMEIPKISKKEMLVVTSREFEEKILPFLKREDYILESKIAFNTGMRVGEIEGLTYDCITKDTIIVEKQWNLTGENKYGFKKLKTENSYRTIPISKNLYKDIMEFRRINHTDITNRVFWKHHSTSSFGTYLKRNLANTKFENLSPHDFRHSYVSALIEQGVDFKTISSLIGDILQTTMSIYSHVNSDAMEKVKKVIENYF